MDIPTLQISQLFYPASSNSVEIPQDPAIDIIPYITPKGLRYEIVFGNRSDGHFETCPASNYLRQELSELVVRNQTEADASSETTFDSLEQGIYSVFGDLIFKVHIFLNGELDTGKIHSKAMKARIK